MQASGQRDREVPIAVAVSRHTEGPNVPSSMAVARAATLRAAGVLAWLGCGAVEDALARSRVSLRLPRPRVRHAPPQRPGRRAPAPRRRRDAAIRSEQQLLRRAQGIDEPAVCLLRPVWSLGLAPEETSWPGASSWRAFRVARASAPGRFVLDCYCGLSPAGLNLEGRSLRADQVRNTSCASPSRAASLPPQ